MKFALILTNIGCCFLAVNLNGQQLKEPIKANSPSEAAVTFCNCLKNMAEKNEKLEAALKQNNEKLVEKLSEELQKEAELLSPCLESLEKTFASVEKLSSPEQIIWEQTMKDNLTQECPKVAAFLKKMDEQAIEDGEEED